MLTGAGKGFSAGGDLGWLRARHEDSGPNNAKIMRDFYSRFLCIRDIEVCRPACPPPRTDGRR